MPRAVARFRSDHPHVEVSLQYIRTRGQKLALANDEIDQGFMIGPFDHPVFDTTLLSSELLYAVIPMDHPLLAQLSLSPADLKDQPVILGDVREWAVFCWQLTDLFNAEGIALRPSLEASNTLALIGRVAAGLGITIYPESLIRYLGKSVAVRPILHPHSAAGRSSSGASATDRRWSGTSSARPRQRRARGRASRHRRRDSPVTAGPCVRAALRFR